MATSAAVRCGHSTATTRLVGEQSRLQTWDRPLTSFGTDAAGEVYVLSFGGPLLRLIEAEAGIMPTETIVPSELVVPSTTGST